MSHPETARRGMHLAEFGMVTAVIGTLLQREIISYEWIIAGLLWVHDWRGDGTLGANDGDAATDGALPRFRRFGRIAGRRFRVLSSRREARRIQDAGALGFEVLLGSLTTTGSLLAFAKLQGLVPGTPVGLQGTEYF